MNFRKQVSEKLTPDVMDKIRKSPKPTKVAEVLAVVKQFPGMAMTFDEIAEIINVSDIGREEKSRPSEYNAAEVAKHPDMRVVRTPTETFIRYVNQER